MIFIINMGIKKINNLPEGECYEYIFDNTIKKYRFCKNNRYYSNMYCYMHSKKNILMINNGVTIENIIHSNDDISPNNIKVDNEDNYLCKKIMNKKLINEKDMKIIRRIIKFLNNSDFYKYEKGKISRPDMMRVNNNGIKIPLEINICYNDLHIIDVDKIEKHLKYNGSHICIVLILTPSTLNNFVKSGSINDVLMIYEIE